MNEPEAGVGAGRRETWTAYGYLSAVGFVLYAIGALTPYLRNGLRLSATQAALHPSALAAGVISAGTIGDAIERRLGRRWAGALAMALLVAGGAGIAVGPVLPVTLAGAYLMGVGAGTMLASVNLTLGRPGGALAEVRLARANVWSMLASMTAPLLIAALAWSPVGWRAVPLLPLAVPILLELAGGLSGGAATRSRPADTGRLGRAFWTGWLFVVVVVSIEFAYVVWGSSVVASRTGVSLDLATALAAVFLGGMLAGRVALSAGLVGAARTPRWVEIALGTAALGGAIVFLSTSPVASAVGLALAGLGTASLYPSGLATALDRAGGAALAAGARLTLASGVAILVVPLVLGAVADAVGVVAGWPLVIALCGVAAILRRVPVD